MCKRKTTYRILEIQDGNKESKYYVQRHNTLFFGLIGYWLYLESIIDNDWVIDRPSAKSYSTMTNAQKALDRVRAIENSRNIINKITYYDV